VVAKRPEADAQSVELLDLLPLLTAERLAAAPEPLLRTDLRAVPAAGPLPQAAEAATVRFALSDDSLDGLLASVGDLKGGAPRQGPAI
jgi:hypothetical protein